MQALRIIFIFSSRLNTCIIFMDSFCQSITINFFNSHRKNLTKEKPSSTLANSSIIVVTFSE